jgi:hypothetical protein
LTKTTFSFSSVATGDLKNLKKNNIPVFWFMHGKLDVALKKVARLVYGGACVAGESYLRPGCSAGMLFFDDSVVYHF